MENNQARLADGTLAGSILKLNNAVKNMMNFTNLTLPEAVKLATINPAKKLGVDRQKGSIEAGKDADLVVLNQTFDPILTISRGEIAYKVE